MRRFPLLKIQVLNDDDSEDDSIVDYREIELQIEDWGLVVRPTGYGDNTSLGGCGCPLFVGFRKGIPVVTIWDDINNEEASHIISLEKAAESNLGETTQ